MKNNIFLKLISSIPSILLFLYFLPFLGILILFLRYFMYPRKRMTTSIFLIIFGLIIFLPSILNLMKIDIPYVKDVMNSEIYTVQFIKYSKLLLTIGIIFLIVCAIMNNLFNKFTNFIYSYINHQEQVSQEISRENDLIMKEKQEKAKNTHVVYCPYCGADNILTSKTGTCKFCRRELQSK